MLYVLPQALDNTANRFPDKEAFSCSGQSLTYAELALRSSSVARSLKEQGVQRGERVGIFMNKSLESVISLYGIMKAGAAYVPIDPLIPAARISYMIKDCGIRSLITKSNKLEVVREVIAGGTTLECILGIGEDGDLPVRSVSWEEITSVPPITNPYDSLTDHDPAIILYTSGSTGNPKGILYNHHSMVNQAVWVQESFLIRPEDRLGNVPPFHFILSSVDLFAGAIAGATTVIIPEAITKIPASFSGLLAEERISVFGCVPSTLVQLIEHGNLHLRDLSNLRFLFIYGEMCYPRQLIKLMAAYPDVCYRIEYGSTEANFCTHYNIPSFIEDSSEALPIGKPIENTEMLIVDEEDQLVAPGEAGELLISNGMFMRGYWGQPEKNEHSFYRRKNSSGFEDLFYRTGDLVQLLPDGNLRHRGRKDRMIKTRGYRVELDEVEKTLLSLSFVEEAAVFTVPDGQGSKLIEAAVILCEQGEMSENQIFEHLKSRLPSYAVPIKIHLSADFPRTSTGKINRMELQAYAIKQAGQPQK